MISINDFNTKFQEIKNILNKLNDINGIDNIDIIICAIIREDFNLISSEINLVIDTPTVEFTNGQILIRSNGVLFLEYSITNKNIFVYNNYLRHICNNDIEYLLSPMTGASNGNYVHSRVEDNTHLTHRSIVYLFLHNKFKETFLHYLATHNVHR